ncbi:hypothetical protein, partial [Escherichia coli]|uniref:hypothetical protein n=1 Tax=Escherichia coli TaxID=562 RepID=UPI0011BA661C
MDKRQSVKPCHMVSVVRDVASTRLVEYDPLADINPFFEHDADIVSVPPIQPASPHRQEVIERDVAIVCGQKTEAVCVNQRTGLAHCVGAVTYTHPHLPTNSQAQH